MDDPPRIWRAEFGQIGHRHLNAALFLSRMSASTVGAYLLGKSENLRSLARGHYFLTKTPQPFRPYLFPVESGFLLEDDLRAVYAIPGNGLIRILTVKI